MNEGMKDPVLMLSEVHFCYSFTSHCLRFGSASESPSGAL